MLSVFWLHNANENNTVFFFGEMFKGLVDYPPFPLQFMTTTRRLAPLISPSSRFTAQDCVSARSTATEQKALC